MGEGSIEDLRFSHGFDDGLLKVKGGGRVGLRKWCCGLEIRGTARTLASSAKQMADWEVAFDFED